MSIQYAFPQKSGFPSFLCTREGQEFIQWLWVIILFHATGTHLPSVPFQNRRNLRGGSWGHVHPPPLCQYRAETKVFSIQGIQIIFAETGINNLLLLCPPPKYFELPPSLCCVAKICYVAMKLCGICTCFSMEMMMKFRRIGLSSALRPNKPIVYNIGTKCFSATEQI